jgi:pilus assembly protein CpaC
MRKPVVPLRCLICVALFAVGGAVAAQSRQAPISRSAALQRDMAEAQTIDLQERDQTVVTLDAIPNRVAIADPSVATVNVLAPRGGAAPQILIYGSKAGTTRLQVWSGKSATPREWTLHISSLALNTLKARGVATDVNVDGAGGKTIVSGTARDLYAHRNALEAASGGFGGGAGVAGSASPSTPGAAQGASASRGATGGGGGASSVVDTSVVGVGGVVQVEVKVVEISRSVMKDVGLSFTDKNGTVRPNGRFNPGNLSSGPNLVADGFSLLYETGGFSAALNLLQSNGMARVLAEPTLVALSGQSASFLAGGEIPVPTSGGLGTQSITYKPFGIGLTVTPTVISRDRIALKVAPEASELDPTNGTQIVNGDSVTIIPALRTRRADTMVELGDGESFVISGLVSRQTKAAVSKIPFLGDLPIIGSFFRGISYSQEDRELVIVVTPRLVRPIARGVTLPLPGDRKEVADRATNAWGYYLMGPAGGQDMPGFSR